jgi:hypothetical protein
MTMAKPEEPNSLAAGLRRLAAEKQAVTIHVHPSGPLLVRGAFALRDGAGNLLPQDRRTLALCRCGRSRQAPLCDGSHKAGRRWDLPSRAGAPPDQTATCSPSTALSDDLPASQEASR